MPKWTKEQEEAIYRKGENIIVSAGAGSGKTAVLTARVIEKLKSGTHIYELLILTFTKAAAAEMKERIRKSIEEIPALKEELKYLDSAYITTFDSYSLSVLKKYHYVLGLDKEIGITESSLLEMKKSEVLEEVFEELYEEENQAFENLISSFMVKDDESLKKSLLEMIKKLELRYGVEDYLDRYLDTYYEEEKVDFLVQLYDSLVREKLEEIEAMQDELEKYVEPSYTKKLEDYFQIIFSWKDYGSLKSALQEKMPMLPRNSEEEVKKKKTELSGLLGSLDDLLVYGNPEDMKKDYLKTKDTVEVILTILKRYFKKLNAFKRENAFYEFSDIAHFAITLLKENESIREEIKNSFEEILVDEYQDTNDLQETFISYIAKNNVYMVGDVKQSIYRFRNANPHIFRKKYNDYQNHMGGVKIDLLSNFRSRREVLEDINQIFCQIMDDEVGGADYEETHQMIFGLTDYEAKGATSSAKSEIWQYIPIDQDGFKKEEVEAFLVARDIEKKVKEGYLVYDKDSKELRAATYQDFVILMDRSTQFDLYRKIFEYLNVPLTVYRDERLEEGEDLALIKNLIDFVIHIYEKKIDISFEYDFVSIARSFLYRMEEEEILKIKMAKKYQETPIYQDLEKVSYLLEEQDIYHLLLNILEVTSFYQKSITSSMIEMREVRMRKTLELAHNLDKSGYSIYQFRDYLETLLEDGYSIRYKTNTDAGNRVKIMTIHTSKGLEYPVCYFTGLYNRFNIQEIKDKFLYQEAYGFVVPFFDEGISETFVKELVKESYLKEEVSEKIRLFYVALTRAREKMIFLLPYEELDWKEKELISSITRKKFRNFASFLNALGGNIQDQYARLELDKNDFTKAYLFPKEITKQRFSSSESLVVEELKEEDKKLEAKHFSKTSTHFPTKEEKENMRFGTLVHEFLEYLDFKNPNLEEIQDTFLRKKIEAFLNHPLLKEKEDATIYKEHEFSYQDGKIEYHGIIDCMLEYPDHIDLIDYKLKHVEDSAYQEQLHGYQTYLEKITKKKVNLYLYSILDSKIEPIS